METTNTHFEIIPALLQEMEAEAVTTRKMLALVPDDKLDWQPHPKSMTMKSLAVHIAEIPSWVDMALNTEELDFAKGYEPTAVSNNAELLGVFEASYGKGHEALKAAKEPQMFGRWVMRMGEQVLADLSKYQTIRHSFSQTTHHRAQLGVYLRLLNIPIPGSYGPSADEMNF
jgi:uncharacterized damage-inducible protein DinB